MPLGESTEISIISSVISTTYIDRSSTLLGHCTLYPSSSPLGIATTSLSFEPNQSSVFSAVGLSGARRGPIMANA
ncbi:uncharacterized protein TrAtP1_002308 [Trichoderma atroviride]|uniref:uncharacterized protein n=1 Tax=Hypocrea atroviridis TaxID=63577 RepID=UPI0033341FEE|nr:hypothetical protein TrAtP1_002308 [Trichoderma atroviride]